MKRFKKLTAFLLATLLLGSLLAACAKEETSTPVEETSATEPEATGEAVNAQAEEVDGELIFDRAMELEYAQNFSADYYKGGYVIFKDSDGREFLVVPEGKSVPAELDEDITVLQAPLTSLMLDSTAFVSLTASFGGLDSVRLVTTDVEGWYIDEVIDRFETGEIAFAGHYSGPDYEMLVDNGIELVISTTMAAGYPEVLEKYTELGIPYLVETSSQENHPLARVEWIKLIGVLTGMEDEALAAFEAQKAKVAAVESDDKTDFTIAIFYVNSALDKFYVRNSDDYIATMLGLAGGTYHLAGLNPGESGTSSWGFEDFYAEVKDADAIFYINMAYKIYEAADLVEIDPLMADFKAVQEGNVWYTAPNFTQSVATIGDIIADMHTVLVAEEKVSTEYIILAE